MRILTVLLLALVSLTGCLNPDGGRMGADVGPIDFYRVAYEGSDVHVLGTAHGWLAVVTNQADEPVVMAMDLLDEADGIFWRAAQDDQGGRKTMARASGTPQDHDYSETLQPGESALMVAEIDGYSGVPPYTAGWRVTAYDEGTYKVLQEDIHSWEVTDASSDLFVQAGDHVQTVTVGMWVNGTSFYTNAAAAIQDPDFPGAPGWVTPEDGTDPLPIYVYDESGSEQPIGSQDTCHFTTITGYNRLLKTQAEGSTGVALLQPEDAYTRADRPDHALYGDALVFMNTIVAHDGATGPEDEAPNEEGECYEPDRICRESSSEFPEGTPDEVSGPYSEQCSEALKEDE